MELAKPKNGTPDCNKVTVYIGTVYTDAVSFVTASVSMRLSKPVVLKTLSKVERFQKDTVSLVV